MIGTFRVGQDQGNRDEAGTGDEEGSGRSGSGKGGRTNAYPIFGSSHAGGIGKRRRFL